MWPNGCGRKTKANAGRWGGNRWMDQVWRSGLSLPERRATRLCDDVSGSGDQRETRRAYSAVCHPVIDVENELAEIGPRIDAGRKHDFGADA